jgi:hypothetical protein
MGAYRTPSPWVVCSALQTTTPRRTTLLGPMASARIQSIVRRCRQRASQLQVQAGETCSNVRGRASDRYRNVASRGAEDEIKKKKKRATESNGKDRFQRSPAGLTTSGRRGRRRRDGAGGSVVLVIAAGMDVALRVTRRRSLRLARYAARQRQPLVGRCGRPWFSGLAGARQAWLVVVAREGGGALGGSQVC